MTTRLLLVDDSELIRRGLRLLLSTDEAFEVVGEAGDGAQALAMIDQVFPDVILSDVRMPRMTGVDLAREVARTRPGLPVILLTTFDDEALVRDAVAAGVSGFLLKDSSTDELVAAIRAAAMGGLVLDPRIARAAVSPPGAEGRSVPPPEHPPAGSDDAGETPARHRGHDPLASLTRTERVVAELVASGATNSEIAARLVIAEGTAKNHVSALLRKLDQRDRTALALFLSQALADAGR